MGKPLNCWADIIDFFPPWRKLRPTFPLSAISLRQDPILILAPPLQSISIHDGGNAPLGTRPLSVTLLTRGYIDKSKTEKRR
ncbi:hypothetical protein Cflav_PD3195 [Pedosphaera parvula Ellin514]|uniref:Uncharacterized protein n=1 Tax=Pedosphaera parvula (strain Ellin514) TaxID=320771 RepID=B9XJ98_PEDPL|nr:hypothetical protein Cflav_PD3195 [Pedosphaera parvula Ellin514]